MARITIATARLTTVAALIPPVARSAVLGARLIAKSGNWPVILLVITLTKTAAAWLTKTIRAVRPLAASALVPLAVLLPVLAARFKILARRVRQRLMMPAVTVLMTIATVQLTKIMLQRQPLAARGFALAPAR